MLSAHLDGLMTVHCGDNVGFEGRLFRLEQSN